MISKIVNSPSPKKGRGGGRSQNLIYDTYPILNTCPNSNVSWTSLHSLHQTQIVSIYIYIYIYISMKLWSGIGGMCKYSLKMRQPPYFDNEGRVLCLARQWFSTTFKKTHQSLCIFLFYPNSDFSSSRIQNTRLLI